MPWVGFEPTIPTFEPGKTVHALDRATTVISGESDTIPIPYSPCVTLPSLRSFIFLSWIPTLGFISVWEVLLWSNTKHRYRRPVMCVRAGRNSNAWPAQMCVKWRMEWRFATSDISRAGALHWLIVGHMRAAIFILLCIRVLTHKPRNCGRFEKQIRLRFC
jgi:hypothetical protein